MSREEIRILLAEDSLFVQQVAVTILDKFGYRVDCVADGRAALAALAREPYALLLMDVQMPGIDGLAATRLVREGEGKVLNPNIPIVAMTGNDAAGDRDSCLAAGMDDYLGKPFTESSLVETLGKWLPGMETIPAEVATNRGQELGSPIFDRRELVARVGNEAALPRLLAMFLAQLPAEIETLKERIAANDVVAAWGQAHKIKGMAANASCRALSVMALQLEKSGKADDLAAMETIFPWLEKQFFRVRVAMEKELR